MRICPPPPPPRATPNALPHLPAYHTAWRGVRKITRTSRSTTMPTLPRARAAHLPSAAHALPVPLLPHSLLPPITWRGVHPPQATAASRGRGDGQAGVLDTATRINTNARHAAGGRTLVGAAVA